MTTQLIEEWPSPQICLLRLNRPEAFNALSRELTNALRDAVARLAASPARVVILTAEGRGFCAGADLKERKSMTDDEKYAHNRSINALANEIEALPMCTIAAFNGTAMGGGVEISLACDLRFAASGVSIGLTEARIGAIPGAGGTQRLPRLIGTAKALEMMFSGEPVTAEKAAEYGLVNTVVPADGLMEHVLSYARLVASRSGRSNALLKDVVKRGMEQDLSDGLEIERQAVVEILASDDYKEGLAAFAERRAPQFA